jgi:hypothetical protein
MKTILIIMKIFSFLLFTSTTVVNAKDTAMLEPSYNKVYRSDRIGDSYHFLLLTKSGMYYHLYSNRTDTLTANELKSKDLLSILKKKQSWGQSFPKSGKYIINNNKIYTQLLWDRIKVTSNKNIKYLNKIFKLQ